MAYSVASFSFLILTIIFTEGKFFFISAVLQVEVKKHVKLTCPTAVTSGLLEQAV